MALFKKKRTIEDLLADVKGLSLDDREAFTARMNELGSLEDAPEGTDGDVNDEAEKPAENGEDATEDGEKPAEDAEGGEKAPKNDLDPKAAEDNDDVTTATEPAPEPPSEEPPAEPKRHEEVNEALSARLNTLEESYNSLLERLEAMADRLDGGDFGNARGKPPEGNESNGGEDSRVMRSYYRKQGDARRY